MGRPLVLAPKGFSRTCTTASCTPPFAAWEKPGGSPKHPGVPGPQGGCLRHLERARRQGHEYGRGCTARRLLRFSAALWGGVELAHSSYCAGMPLERRGSGNVYEAPPGVRSTTTSRLRPFRPRASRGRAHYGHRRPLTRRSHEGEFARTGFTIRRATPLLGHFRTVRT
jgi:hypothetical protein